MHRIRPFRRRRRPFAGRIRSSPAPTSSWRPEIILNRVYRLDKATGEIGARQYGPKGRLDRRDLCYPPGEGATAQASSEYGARRLPPRARGGVFASTCGPGTMSHLLRAQRSPRSARRRAVGPPLQDCVFARKPISRRIGSRGRSSVRLQPFRQTRPSGWRPPAPRNSCVRAWARPWHGIDRRLRRHSGRKGARRLDIVGVPTSERTRLQAEGSAGIRLSTLDETPELDLTVDG